MISLRYQGDKFFAFGISLAIQGLIIFTISDIIALTRETLAILVVSMFTISVGLSFTIYEFSRYLRRIIVIKSPLEPLLLSTMIIVPLYMASSYWLIKTLSSKLFEELTALELYIMSAMLPTVVLILVIYILSS